jgi:RNA polymerase sigma-70 factor (ECF subfamily)
MLDALIEVAVTLPFSDPPDAVSPGPPDEQLMTAISAGDASAFATLMQRYAERLLAFALASRIPREAAEDIVQEVFCRVWMRRGHLRIEHGVRGYLYASTHHLVVDHVRHVHVERRVEPMTDGAEAELEVPDETARTDLALEQAELQAGIARAIAQLPERCRLVYVLRWYHRPSYAEIATTLGVSIKAIEMQHARGAKTLRRLLARFLP